MKWKTPIQEEPIDGASYIWTGFLWLPTTIDGITRWLEIASIRRECKRYHTSMDGTWFEWTNLEWLS